MKTRRQTPPDDVAALKAALLRVEAELAVARAKAADDQAVIAHQKRQQPVSTAGEDCFDQAA